MIKKRKIMRWVIISAAVFVIIVWYLNTSLWFSWHVIGGQAEVRLAARTDTQLWDYLVDNGDLVPKEYGDISSRVMSVAVSGVGEKQVVAVVPRLTAQWRIAAELSKHGWKTKRYGLVILLGRDEPTEITAIQGFGKALVSMFDIKVPVSPVLLVAVPSGKTNLLSENILGVVTGRQKSVRLRVFSGGNSQKVHNVVVNTIFTPDLDIAIPGSVLANMTESAKDSWNGILWHMLGLEQTRPPIIEYVSQYNQVYFTLINDGIALGINGSSEVFIDTVRKWVAEEGRNKNLVTRAFTLPDGTIGYEQVRGEAVNLFTPSENQCYEATERDLPLWLCASDSTVIFSSSEGLARREIEGTGVDWRIVVSESFWRLPTARAICVDDHETTLSYLCGLQSIAMVGNEGFTLADITLK